MANCIEEFEEYIAIRKMSNKTNSNGRDTFKIELIGKTDFKKSNFNALDYISVFPNLELSVEELNTKTDKNNSSGESYSWAISALGADTSQFDGSGVKLAVIDDGIYKDHPCFDGKLIKGYNFVNNSPHLNESSHGNKMTSLICGKQYEEDGKKYRFGIAPGIKDIFFYCIFDKNSKRTTIY